MNETITSNTEDVLEILCSSVQKVLSMSTQTDISSPRIAQKIKSVCLRPDIGCFVVMEGGLSGLIILNFSGDAALEIYKQYMLSMGMPEDELASHHTSGDVADSLGELMNQIFGDFRMNLEGQAKITVKQNVPKMINLNEAIVISRASTISKPEYRRVAFFTESRKPFYLQVSLEDIEFIQLPPRKETGENINTDDIMAEFGDK